MKVRVMAGVEVRVRFRVGLVLGFVLVLGLVLW